MNPAPQRGIAIVGLGALYPGSTDRHGFWRDILAGRDLVTDVPPTHWLIEDYYHPDPAAPDRTYGRRGAFVPTVDFDPMEFAMPPSILSSTDTSQLLALMVAKQVLEDAAGGQFAGMDRERISVILGVASTTELVVELGSRLQRPVWVKALREEGLPEDQVQAVCDRIAGSYVPWTESSFPGLLGNVVAGRIANRFDLGGTNCVIDAACASSLSALHLALLELHSGQSDLAIAGGVDTLNDILMYTCFSKTPALSPTGDCRPFSDRADGTILGEGLGMVALKRLSDAERDGDRIYGVIRGLGTSSDGKSKSVYAPVPEGQAKALRRAYEAAGYDPGTVELLEAHGTATRAGDAAEFEGLRTAYGAGAGGARQWCALGSIKSQIGHTKAAAGAAGLLKAVLALHHKVLPPTIKVERPNPGLDLESSPFYLNTRARPWIRDGAHPRRAAVSSFGFGGSNYHVTVEEYTGAARRPARSRTLPAELVLLGASGAAELAAECGRLAEAVAGGSLSFWAFRTQTEYLPESAHRLALVASSEAELRKLLEQAAELLGRGPEGSFALPGGAYYGSGPVQGETAFLFPGQGSQRVEMGSDLAISFDAARRVWDMAAGVEMGDEGQRLHQVVFPIPAFTAEERDAQRERLTATEWAQPALAATSLSYLALLRQAGLRPACLGGHSFGELTALCAAGALEPEDLLRVARRRGELMAAAAGVPGAMTAVTGVVGDLAPRVAASGIDVVAANHNGPHQIVFSGREASIEELERWLEGEEGLSFQRLPVSTAFHSPLVAPSVEPFREFLRDVPLRAPEVPVYANVTGERYPEGAEAMRELLACQLSRPVRFSDEIEAMYEAGVRVFVEVGPGSALTGMVERILGERPFTAVGIERRGQPGAAGLWHALGRLVAAGARVDPGALWDGYAVPSDPASRPKPRLTVPINGANHAKPYPPEGGAAALPAPNPPRREQRPPAEAGAPSVAPPPMAALDGADPVPSAAQEIALGAATASPPIPLPVLSTNGSMPEATHQPAAGADLPPHIRALLEMHRETALAHSAYLSAMAETHTAYLNAMAGALGGMPAAELHGGGAAAAAGAPPPPPAVPTAAALPRTNGASAPSAPAPAALVAESLREPSGAPAVPPSPRAETRLEPPSPAAPALVKDTAPAARETVPAAAQTAPAALQTRAGERPVSVDLEALLLAVVADKTGYPVDMLDLSLELEAGLGIDSIKRVEILSALREQAPGLPEVQPSQLASLRTLAEIIGFMRESSPGGEPDSAPPPTVAAPAAELQLEVPIPAVVDLPGLLLAIVADKTGYPVDMLDLSLELESGLGIDSIKRVEILSALREQAPGLPEVQPSQLASLRTLGEIIEFMDRGPAGANGAADAPARASGTAARDAGDRARGVPAAERTASEADAAPLQRFEVRAVAAPAAGFAMRGLLESRGPIAITDDGRGVAPLLAARLAELGVASSVVREIPADAAGVVHLAGIRSPEEESAALSANREAFAAARAVAERFTREGGLFVTVQDTGGDFALSGLAGPRVWSAGLSGLAKTAAREWPLAAVKAIDLACEDRTPEDLADALAAELLLGGPELEVGLSPRLGRVTVHTERAAAPAGEWALGEGDVLVATGGARGVTAACLLALAGRVRPRIALLGRTPTVTEDAELAAAADEGAVRDLLLARAREAGEKPTPAELGRRVATVLAAREVAATVRGLEEAGAEVLYLPCDVADGAAVAGVLAGVRRSWGRIDAILHGAGVIADRRIEEKTDEQFDRVFAAKVGGLRSLLDATAGDSLKAILLFSSVAARTGNPGQCDYAMANEILNRVACAEGARREGCVVRALGWGPWDGGMVTPSLRSHFERLQVPLIPLAAGAAAFVEECRSGGGVEVVLGRGAPEAGLDPSAPRAWSMEVLVDERSYPALASHRIQGLAVLPVVLVVEWLVRAAAACCPGRGLPRVRDLRVLRGVRLGGFSGAGDRLVVQLEEVPDAEHPSLRMELRGPDGGLHYSALAEFGSNGQPARAELPELVLDAWEWLPGELYGDRLFHGPDFQAIRSLDGVSAEGAAARLAGARELGWSNGWRTDLVALDGGLQLARLWGIHHLGRPSLPTRIASITLHGPQPLEGPIRCMLRSHASGDLRTVSDISLFGEGGRLLAELEGVEMHLMQGAPGAE